jgi:hypothetical protein
MEARGASPDVMGAPAGAVWLSDDLYRLGVEHHLGQLHQDQVADDESA